MATTTIVMIILAGWSLSLEIQLKKLKQKQARDYKRLNEVLRAIEKDVKKLEAGHQAKDPLDNLMKSANSLMEYLFKDMGVPNPSERYTLAQKLEMAIARNDFEEAARIREEIKKYGAGHVE